MSIRGVTQLQAKLAQLSKAIATTLPKRVAADAERWYKDSFRNQGFTDSGLVRWPKTKKGKPGRILKKTGLLMNSVKAEAEGLNIRVSAGGPQIPYAKIHNEGGTIEGTYRVRAHIRRAHGLRASRKAKRAAMTRLAGTVKAHDRRVLTYMAKRQFIGRSKLLEAKLRARAIATVSEVFQPAR